MTNQGLILETASKSGTTNESIAMQLGERMRWRWRGRQRPDHEGSYVLLILKSVGSNGIIFPLSHPEIM